MLVVKNQEHFDKVYTKAVELGLDVELQHQLDWLAAYACHETPEDTRCDLYYDFAPLSFSFVMQRKGDGGDYKRWFNGGLIYHPGSTGRDVSLSVELSSRKEAHWSVHT